MNEQTEESLGTAPHRPHAESSGFRLLDGFPVGGESIEFRREVKFLLPYADLGKLRSILEVNCRRVCYQGPVSLVNSIYFDDSSLSAYRQSIEGTGKRSKVRLRWYDRNDSEGRFHFEVKRRRELAVGKERLAMGSPAPLSSLAFSDIRRELCRALPARYRELLMSRPEAILITEYKREYFQAYPGSVRITLDYDVTYFDQLGRRRPQKSFAVRAPETVIVEGKAPLDQERELPHLLFPLQPRVTRSSKYVLGCERLGIAPVGT